MQLTAAQDRAAMARLDRGPADRAEAKALARPLPQPALARAGSGGRTRTAGPATLPADPDLDTGSTPAHGEDAVDAPLSPTQASTSRPRAALAAPVADKPRRDDGKADGRCAPSATSSSATRHSPSSRCAGCHPCSGRRPHALAGEIVTSPTPAGGGGGPRTRDCAPPRGRPGRPPGAAAARAPSWHPPRAGGARPASDDASVGDARRALRQGGT